jgi:Myb-like DNA-binding domain
VHLQTSLFSNIYCCCSVSQGRWTAQEDKILLNAIKQHGTLWYKVAKHLPGRTDDQAAKRFREKLDPSISRTPWTEDEDEILVNMWRKVGKRWNLISKELKGRPAVHCRNRWQSLFRVGKVDGTSLDQEPDFTMDDDVSKAEDDVDEGSEVFLSPTDSIDVSLALNIQFFKKSVTFFAHRSHGYQLRPVHPAHPRPLISRHPFKLLTRSLLASQTRVATPYFCLLIPIQSERKRTTLLIVRTDH